MPSDVQARAGLVVAVSTEGPGPCVLPCAWLQGIPVGTESSLVCFFLNRLAVSLRALYLDTARLGGTVTFQKWQTPMLWS